MNLSEAKDFVVSTASLKEVREFSREIFFKNYPLSYGLLSFAINLQVACISSIR